MRNLDAILYSWRFFHINHTKTRCFPFTLLWVLEVERIQGRLKKRRNPVILRPDLPFSSDILVDLAEGKIMQDAREVQTKFSKSFTTIFFPVGDEIRQIAPKMYLGKVYWEKKRLIDFALQFE